MEPKAKNDKDIHENPFTFFVGEISVRSGQLAYQCAQLVEVNWWMPHIMANVLFPGTSP